MRVRRENERDVPVLRFCANGGEVQKQDFEEMMRADYANCEMRSFLVAF